MICKHCGAEISPGLSFCGACGAKQETTDLFSTSGSVGLESAKKEYEGKKVDKAEFDMGTFGGTPAPVKPKKKKWLPFLIAGGVLLLAIIIFLICSFPLRMTISSQNELQTTTGKFENFEISVSSNQPISNVYYSVDPKDFENLDSYTAIKGGGIYSRKVTIDELKVPAGESKMYVCATTVFGGKKFHEVQLEFDMGYISAPEKGKIMEYAEGKKMVSNELLLIAKAGTAPQDIEQLVQSYNGQVVGAIYPVNQYQIRFHESGKEFIDQKISELKRSNLVEDVIYNSVYESSSMAYPDDSEYDSWEADKNNPQGNNWGLECIDAPTAWNYNDKMSVVKVGVIDSYLNYNHEDLQVDKKRFMFMPSSDFSDPDEFWNFHSSILSSHDCRQDNCNVCGAFSGHGSHVAGIMGAIKDNKGICGVNWNADVVFASLWHIYKEQGGRYYSYSDTTASFNMALTHCILSDCRVINMSFGNYSPTITANEDAENAVFDNMIATFESQGYDFLIFKSAGNESVDASTCRIVRKLTSGNHARAHTVIVGSIGNYPNRYDGLTGTYFNKSQFSNYGADVDIMSPGEEILSTVGDNQYVSWQGTSMATPMAAGVASMVYSLNPSISYDYVKSLICNTNDSWCYYDGITYPVLDAGKSLKYAVDNDWANANTRPEPTQPKLGYIHGLIQDAETGRVLPNATLRCVRDDGAEYRVGTYEGVYQCQLPAGIYDMEFACDGYISEVVYDVEVTTDVITYNVLLNMVKENGVKGRATGYVIDAFDASTISNASIKLYRGLNCTTGNPIRTFSADGNGFYNLELAPGNYTVVANASGYQQGFGNILVLPNQTKDNQHCTLVPVLNEGEIRVVLTWGANPSDLDSHMVGPSPDGRFHTFFSNKNHYYQNMVYCNLDVDDTTSYGPETTSVYRGTNGTYTFYVHDYSNREARSSSSMASSGAEVKVYVAGQSAPKIFNVPNVQGTLWKVCSIKNGVITPINDVTYQEDYESIGSSAAVR